MYRDLYTNRELHEELMAQAGQQLPEAWESISSFTSAALEQGILHYEDATPLVYLKGACRRAAPRWNDSLLSGG